MSIRDPRRARAGSGVAGVLLALAVLLPATAVAEEPARKDVLLLYADSMLLPAGRPKDNIGLGWARTQFSEDFVPFLRQRLDLGLNKEDAVELYYNAVLTPWLNLNANLQIVQSALKRNLNSSGQLVDMDTAVVGGLRAYIRF